MGSSVSKAVEKLQREKNLPPFISVGLLHLASRLVVYWPFVAFCYIVEKYKLLHKYKIQPNRSPKWEMFLETLKHNISVDIFQYWGVALFFYKILTLGGQKKNKEKTAESEEPAEGDGIGWSKLRLGGKAPKTTTAIWQVLVGFLGYDMMFYWSHRLLHRPELYKHIHKFHHNYHTPVALASSHEHIVESIAQLFNWYIPIGFAGYLNGDLHGSTLFYYNCFRWIESADAHAGYEFPFSPFHLIPGFGGATRHDFHHREFWGNYGASTFWDWLCGTDKEFWEEVAENAALKAKKALSTQ